MVLENVVEDFSFQNELDKSPFYDANSSLLQRFLYVCYA